MDVWNVLLDVVVLLAVAMVMGLVFERLGQSAIVAYLLTGTLVGPGVLGLVRTEEAIRSLAELGVALLLFTIGLEFSWKRLRELGVAALAGGTLQLVLTGVLLAVGAVLCGASVRTAVAIGAVAAPSSTACVLRVLGQRAELDSIHGRMSLGILLLQDAAVIPLIVLVTTLGRAEGETGGVMVLIESGLWAALLAIGFFLVVNYVIPHLLDAAVLTRNRELPILFAAATCLAAAWAAHALQFSPVLGAFVAGVLLAESPYATWIRSDVSVLRTLFVTLFFASVGMLDDVDWLRTHWHWLAVSVPVVLALKGGVVVIVGLILKMPLRYAVAGGLCLAQLGEFSFVLAAVAESGGVFSSDLFNLTVTTTVLTLILTPYLVAWAPRLSRWMGERASARRFGAMTAAEREAGAEHWTGHVVIVGFGPAGRGAWRAIRDSGLSTVVVDLNRRSIEEVRSPDVHAVVGDATQEAVLEHAHVSSARAVVITVPDHRSAMQIIAQVRILAPGAGIFVRARYDIWSGQLEAEGATAVNEERETGSRMGRVVVEALGAKNAADLD